MTEPGKKGKMKTSPINDIFASAERLLGRTSDDPELKILLQALGFWPLPEFESEESSIYLEDEARGFCLVFDDSSSLEHPLAAGKPPGTPIFRNVFLYSEGVGDYHAYKGTLPHGITWSDTANTLVAKMGPPKNEIKNKKTGKLSAHRWPAGRWMLTASYGGGGSSLNRLNLDILGGA